MWGISSRTTSIGWTVNRIHYSADEDKDPRTEHGRQWLANAKKGISDARWRKEFEIDFGALGGQLCFPTFDESKHVVPFFLRDPREWTIYQACDPHPRTAHAFVWLGVNRYGELVVPWSWWPEALHREHPLITADYAAKLKLLEEKAPELVPEFRYMDVAGRNFNASENKNFFQRYKDYDLHFQPAKRDLEDVGIDLINEALALTNFDGEVRPKLTIMDGCGDNEELIQEMKTLRFREHRGLVVDKDAPEEPEQKRRHLVDGLVYCLLAKPEYVEHGRTAQRFKPAYPNLGY